MSNLDYRASIVSITTSTLYIQMDQSFVNQIQILAEKEEYYISIH